jgi:hypothetical protein
MRLQTLAVLLFTSLSSTALAGGKYLPQESFGHYLPAGSKAHYTTFTSYGADKDLGAAGALRPVSVDLKLNDEQGHFGGIPEVKAHVALHIQETRNGRDDDKFVVTPHQDVTLTKAADGTYSGKLETNLSLKDTAVQVMRGGEVYFTGNVNGETKYLSEYGHNYRWSVPGQTR